MKKNEYSELIEDTKNAISKSILPYINKGITEQKLIEICYQTIDNYAQKVDESMFIRFIHWEIKQRILQEFIIRKIKI